MNLLLSSRPLLTPRNHGRQLLGLRVKPLPVSSVSSFNFNNIQLITTKQKLNKYIRAKSIGNGSTPVPKEKEEKGQGPKGFQEVFVLYLKSHTKKSVIVKELEKYGPYWVFLECLLHTICLLLLSIIAAWYVISPTKDTSQRLIEATFATVVVYGISNVSGSLRAAVVLAIVPFVRKALCLYTITFRFRSLEQACRDIARKAILFVGFVLSFCFCSWFRSRVANVLTLAVWILSFRI